MVIVNKLYLLHFLLLLITVDDGADLRLTPVGTVFRESELNFSVKYFKGRQYIWPGKHLF